MFEYDVFLSHAGVDKPAVETVARKLRDEHGLRVFFDQWALVPGTHWQDALLEALAGSSTCAIFLGSNDLGPWHNEEMRVALNQRLAEEPKRVIPVLLPGSHESAVPEFLAQRTWVDLRGGFDDEVAFDRLVAGIRGRPPVQEPPARRDGEETTAPSRSWRSSVQGSSSRRRRVRRRYLGISIAVLGAFLTTLAWCFPRDPGPEPAPQSSPDLYALRVQVLDPSGRPLDGSSVRVSSGNEPHLRPDGWWQIEIPRTKVPFDGRVTLWAEHPQWSPVRKILHLGEEPNPQAEVQLGIPRERIAGVVVDASGAPLEGARLSIRSHSGTSATSNPDGQFELWVTAAKNESVRVHIEHVDFPPQDGSCYAGRDGCPLVLQAEL